MENDVITLGAEIQDEQKQTTVETTTDINEDNGNNADINDSQKTELDASIEKETDLNNDAKDTKSDDGNSNIDAENPKTDETNKPNLEISLNKENVETSTDDNAKETEQINFTEENVLQFLKEKGIELDNLKDLSKPTLSDEVAKFQKFVDETGRGHSDFYNSQKDWSKVDKDKTIYEFYKSKHPNMTDEDISKGVKLLKVTEEDEDDLTETEISKRKFDYSKIYSEALQYMTEKSEMYKTSLGNKQQQEPEKQVDYTPYWEANQEAIESMEDVTISLKDLGDINLQISDKQRETISKDTHTFDDFFARWKDDKGMINNSNMAQDMLWANPESRSELLSNMLEQMYVLVVDKQSKENRNVNLDGSNIPQAQNVQNEKGVEIIGDKNINPQDSKMGTSVI